MAGPLSCLWSDLSDPNAKVDPQAVIQRVLVYLVEPCIRERRMVAWSRINPSTISLIREQTEDKKEDATLFGGGFLERATKKLEDEKALAKVMGARPGRSATYKKQPQDPNDLKH